jgi:hypothetical protein
MTFGDYQKVAQSTAIYPTDLKAIDPALCLAGEISDVPLGKIKHKTSPSEDGWSQYKSRATMAF